MNSAAEEVATKISIYLVLPSNNFIQISTGALCDIITLEIGLLQERNEEIENELQKKHRRMLHHSSFTE